MDEIFLTKTAKHSLNKKKMPWQNLKHNQFCKKSVTTNINVYNIFIIWTDPESHRTRRPIQETSGL